MANYPSLTRLLEADAALQVRTDPELNVVRHLRGRLTKPTQRPADAIGRRFVADHEDLFGDVDVEKAPVIVQTEDDGGNSVVLQQQHKGVRVLDGSVRFKTNKDGELTTVSSALYPDLADVPAKAKVAAARAVDVIRSVSTSGAELESEPELVVVRHEGRPYLAWETRFTTDPDRMDDRDVPVQAVGYVDATSGELLYWYNNIQTAGPVVANGTGYYSGPGAVNAWFTDTTFQLRDTTRTAAGGPEIRTGDEDGASPSEDVDGDWNTATVAPRDSNQGPEIDAHRYTGTVIDYFRTVHGRTSFDGGTATAEIVAHLGTDYSNGYWDGTRVNLGDGQAAAPGDDYECTDDWLAHEWTHAYTQYTCGLQYLNESGALNEAFSDVMAAFITANWLVFERSWRRPGAPASRNMIDPTNGGQWNSANAIGSVLAGHQPSHYSVRYTGGQDNGGVHINSGIINNLFYLLTVGGTHTVSGIAVSGIGQSAAERMLWRCMSVNLVGKPTATFLQFREAMLDACLDLFPTDLFKLTQVKRAFNAVGIGPDIYVRDNVDDTGDEPYTGAYLFASPDIINRISVSANPAVDFADLTNDALWQNVEFGQDNQIYVRLQNRGPQTGDATIRVYLANGGTFGTPASWQFLGTLLETGIAPTTTRISGPLLFPKAAIPSVGHYCMVAVVSSTLDPAPDHTLITSVNDYLDYVRGTNNIAYRNMDVVDELPDMPGVFEVVVRGLKTDPERYSLRLHVAGIPKGARLRVRGPAHALADAEPQGMKLVERTEREHVYSVLAGEEMRDNFRFLGRERPRARLAPGFEQLAVKKDFRLIVEYEFDPKSLRSSRARKTPPSIVVEQLWKDESVGAFGLRFTPRKD